MTTLSAALGGLVVVAFQDSVFELFNPNRLIAEISAGPWLPDGPLDELRLEQLSEAGFGYYSKDRFINGEPLSFARMVVRNSGNKTVGSIRINFGSFEPNILLSHAPGKGALENVSKSSLTLPDMSPGDEIYILMWSIHDLTSKYRYRELKTFSDQGPITVRIIGSPSYTVQSDFWDFIEFFSVFIFVVGVVISAIILFASTYLFRRYSKNILSNEEFYLAERIRYENDVANFSPNLDGP